MERRGDEQSKYDNRRNGRRGEERRGYDRMWQERELDRVGWYMREREKILGKGE